MALLEYLWKRSGYMYLSDMKAVALSTKDQDWFISMVRRMDADMWSGDEWRETIKYITAAEAPASASAEECRLLLLSKLDLPITSHSKAKG